MRQLLCLLVLFKTIACNNSAPTINIDKNVELKKWKSELLLNGDVGPPCKDDYQRWAEENPSYYFGMQKIDTLTFDINNDKIIDALFYFPAQNCVSGNGEGSDFALLVYSNKGEYLTNKNLSGTIEKNIKFELSNNGIYNIDYIILNYKSLTNRISGEYVTWLKEDAHCCPSYNGTYEYDPIKFTTKLTAVKTFRIKAD